MPAGQTGGGQWTSGEGGSDADGDDGVPDGGEDENDDPLLHRVAQRGASPLGSPQLANAVRSARSELAKVRELDPNWRTPPSLRSEENVAGLIAHYEAIAQAARARYAEITRDAIPGTNPSWGINRLRKELGDMGYNYIGPATRSPGFQFYNPRTGDWVRIMDRPTRAPFRTDHFKNSTITSTTGTYRLAAVGDLM